MLFTDFLQCDFSWKMLLSFLLTSKSGSMIAADEVIVWEHCATMLSWKANLWSVFCCVFQLGDPRGLHHHTPSACCQGETVYREHRGAGTGGQRTGQGNTFNSLFYCVNTEML